MRRPLFFPLAALVLILMAPPAASAQQTFNVSIGGFTPRSLDARGNDDVIFRNNAYLSTLNRDVGIDISKFNGVTISGEYLVALGRNLEGSLGIGLYQKTVTTVDTLNVHDVTGSDIFQDDKLRIVPFTATVRFLPLSHDSPFQPYIGAGVGVFAWRYSETGEFIDSRSNIFAGNFVGSGTEVGPVVLGGVRVPMGPTSIGGEIRWQGAKANLPTDQGFAGSKINLGGVNYLFTVGFRF